MLMRLQNGDTVRKGMMAVCVIRYCAFLADNSATCAKAGTEDVPVRERLSVLGIVAHLLAALSFLL